MAKKDKKLKKKKEKSKPVITESIPASTTNLKANETETNLTADDIAPPPPTPSSQFDFELNFQTLPNKSINLDNLKIPEVKRNGIKLCIDTLADYFQCQDYKFNPIQFWFLDTITDCLWKAQDEFRFPDQLQKIVLNWILFIFDKIKDPQENITRKKLFTIFKESILMGAEYVDEGGILLPAPEKLFVFTSTHCSDDSLTGTSSVSLHSSEKDAESVILFNQKNKAGFFTLKQEVCQCNQFDVSSVDSIAESGFTTDSEGDILEEEHTSKTSFKDLSFGKDDSNEDYLVEDLKGDFDIISATSSLTISGTSVCPSKIFTDNIKSENSKTISKVSVANMSSNVIEDVNNETDIAFDRSSYSTKMKILTEYLTNIKLNEQKVAAMDDSEKGWFSSQEIETTEEDQCNESEWMDIVDKYEDYSGNIEDAAFINFGVLWAIIDFVFNYFYESFQFALIKLAFREAPSIIVQRINQEWKTPKVPKGEFVPPPVKKPKKEKKEKKKKKGKEKKKEKKGKKSKKDKVSVKSKKSKKSKGSAASKKVKKEKKDKKKKKDKKEKKEKPPKLTKEEKEELEQLKLEQERLEEERREREENRRLLFPLNDAINDDFFTNIFDGWVKINLTEEPKGKKNKKNKPKKKK